MKLKHEFIVRQIAGEYVLIPMGKSALAFSGMVTTNEVGAFICRQLAKPVSQEALLDAICAEFEVSRQTAQEDMEQFLRNLRKADLLEE